jgi:phosphatidylglycerol:prolipoprotein diacylglycerol transferase
MYPWIDFFYFKIPTFGLMVATAFLVCHYLLKKDFIKNKYDSIIVDDIIFYSAISAILGSKIYYIIETSSYNLVFQNIKNIFSAIFTANFSNAILELQNFGSGLVFNGGFICAVLFILIYLKKKSLNFFSIADLVAPYILLGHGIGRIGCFLVGDDYGVPSNLPWAVSFKQGMPVSTITTFLNQYSFLNYSASDLKLYLINGSETFITVHPTQIYEMLLYFIGFYIIKSLYNRYKDNVGFIFSCYLIYGGISRFMVEFLRTNERYMFNFSSAQFISIFLILIGIFISINSLNKNNYGKN